MVQSPEVTVEIAGADDFQATGAHADCAVSSAQAWADVCRDGSLPACRVAVTDAPARHVGLGSGTQLALSVAAGLHAWHEQPPPTALELAELTGRGQRSAVGTYGFVLGGLIVESGKLPRERLSLLQSRVCVPDDWRFVLVRLGGTAGLHGSREHRAFDELPAVAPETRQALQAEVREHLLPAIRKSDCAAFGESVYRFGYRAGECFAPVQGGPYNGRRVAELVAEIRELGVPGVGQSSWGPTLFCIVPGPKEAGTLVDELRRRHQDEQLEIDITAADNAGAQVIVE